MTDGFKRFACVRPSFFINTLFVATLTSAPIPALAQTLQLAQGAGSITPGGVQPQLQERVLPKEEVAPIIHVPAVPKRPLDIGEGPVVQVQRFVLKGADILPPLDIQQLLDQQLKAYPNGFTIGELQQTADILTQRYRQQGFILAQAFIPEQNIENETVVIQILSGRLGQLSVDGSNRYHEPLLTRIFKSQVGETVSVKAAESALLSINDLPGLTVSGIFRPGEHVGDTELVLKVAEEVPFEFALSTDNHGVETTGQQRLFAYARWNNPTGYGDQLTVTALQTFDPEDSTYGAFGYEIPILTPHLLAGINYSTNDYDIAQSISRQIPETDGDTETATVYARYQLIRSRQFNLSTTVDFSRKWAEVGLNDFPLQLVDDNLSVFSIAFDVEQVDSRFRGLNQANIRYSHGLADFLGSMDSNGDEGAVINNVGGDFQKIALEATRLQSISQNHNILFRFESQFSDDVLSSLEQFSIGGPNSVRAYPVSEFIRDKALFTSVAWIINAPGFASQPAFAGRTWGEVFKVSFFADYAVGKLNDARSFDVDGNPLGNRDEKIEIGGAGIGLELSLPGSFFIRAEAAKALGSRDDSRGDDSQYWISAGFRI